MWTPRFWGNIQGMGRHDKLVTRADGTLGYEETEPFADSPLEIKLHNGKYYWTFAVEGSQYCNGPFDSKADARRDYARFLKEGGARAPDGPPPRGN